MSKNKTTENQNNIPDFLASIKDHKRREDCTEILKILTKSTGIEPKMWGTNIVGFGSYRYKYESGHEGSAPLTGIASRSNALVIYLSADFKNKDSLLAEFGKYKTGKGCIYIQKLEDINIEILKKMVHNSMEHIKSQYSH